LFDNKSCAQTIWPLIYTRKWRLVFFWDHMWLEFAGDKVTIATDRMSRKILENRIRSLTHMQQSQIYVWSGDYIIIW